MTAPTFVPLAARSSAVDACAVAIRDAILQGRLEPGARLPAERTLAAELGVSRLTLRAGLAKVAATGLLSVRHGSGYRVEDFRRRGGGELLPGLLQLAGRRDQLATMAADLLRIRRHLAQAVLEQIAEVGRPGAADRVNAVVDRFALVAAQNDRAKIAAADLDVVAALLAETGSAVMPLCLNPVLSVITSLPALRDAIYADPARNVLGWRALAGWLLHRRKSELPQMIALLVDHDRRTVGRIEKGPKR